MCVVLIELQLDETSFAWMMRVANAVEGKVDYGETMARLCD